MQTFLFKNQTVLYKISLNSVFMILFRMYNVSVLCVEIMGMYGWITLKCVIPVQFSKAFIALNLFYILPYKVDRIEEFEKREGGVSVCC